MPTLTQKSLWETIRRRVDKDGLNIRCVTYALNCQPCAAGSTMKTAEKLRAHICQSAKNLIPAADRAADRYGLPITNKRIATTPITLLAGGDKGADLPALARAMDAAVTDLNGGRTDGSGVTFIGGYTALAAKGLTATNRAFLRSLDEALGTTSAVCGSIELASTRSGINLPAVAEAAAAIVRLAGRSPDGAGAAKFVALANAPSDNPFMAGAFHGPGEPDAVLSVGLSAAGTVLRAVEECGPADLAVVAERVKATVYENVLAAQAVGRWIARDLGVEFGVVDLSLAPEPVPARNSVARIIEAMGLERCGAPGTVAALLLLTDAVKKGGAAAAVAAGGLSGAFIPVSEDVAMAEAARTGAVSLAGLMAMSAVCSVGLDMVGLPGDTRPATIAGIIADEMAIGVANNKTTAVRVIPVPGAAAGTVVDLTGYNPLLGTVVVMDVSRFRSEGFFARPNTRIPAPLKGLTN